MNSDSIILLISSAAIIVLVIVILIAWRMSKPGKPRQYPPGRGPR